MKNITLWVCLLISSIGISQTAPSFELPEVIPSSPEVASLLRYSEVPVSYYNGVPNIGVPIYTLQGRELSVPISLSYHAGGHRVNEEASWVGLGWNLSAGGQISRVVRGVADDLPDGFIHNPETVQDIIDACDSSDQASFNLCVDATLENRDSYDLQPDDFNYSMFGQSGRFMFNQNRTVNPKGEIVQFPDKNVKIVPTFSTDPLNRQGQIIGWTITDTNGVIYEFTQGSRFTYSQTFSKRNGAVSFPTGGASTNSYIETWNLVKATTPNGDEVTFEYTHEYLPSDTQSTYSEFTLGSQNLVLNPMESANITGGVFQVTVGDPYLEESYQKTNRYIEYLDKITTSKGYVKFIKDSGQRLDVPNNSKRLKAIEVYTNENDKLQTITLTHGYFESIPEPNMMLTEAVYASAHAQSVITRRLYLQKVKFHGNHNGDNAADDYSYSFKYNDAVKLPQKQSYAQDHWGYYNGTNNTSLISIPTGVNLGSGADREVNPAFSDACMLSEITYPEGAVTKLAYENNRGDIRGVDLPPYAEKQTTVKALASNQHTITENGATTIYRFNSDNFTISANAKPSQTNASMTQLSYEGFSNRCDNADAIYGAGDQVCNNMFFRIYEIGSVSNPIEFSIWERGHVLLEKGKTYKLEIEITSTNDDYNLINHYSEASVKWLDENTNTETETFDYFGGLRIKSIKTYDKNKLTAYKSYEYSGGFVLSTPLYLNATTDVINYVTYSITSASSIPLLTTQSGYVGYTDTKETIHPVAIETGYSTLGNSTPESQEILRNYSKSPNNSSAMSGTVFVDGWRNGNLLIEEVAGKQSKINEYQDLLSSQGYIKGVNLFHPIRNVYTNVLGGLLDVPTFLQNNNLATSTQLSSGNSIVIDGTYELHPKNTLVKKQTVISKEGTRELTSSTESFYESIPHHHNPTKTTTTDSKGDEYVTMMRYPYEENHTGLLSENRLSTPLVTKQYKDTTLMQTTKMNYSTFTGTANNLSNLLPASIEGAKKLNPLEERVSYHDYTPYGQPREVSKTDGTHITYLWGYNYNYPVAKIENATYAQVTAVVSESSLQNLTGTALEAALANLRSSLPNAMISTFVYEPMIGVVQTTDPRGRNTYYQYDSMGRLKYVLDHDQHVLSENNYHYKNN